jgi:hypothetical protein
LVLSLSLSSSLFLQTQHLLNTASQRKVSNSVTKVKISGTVTTSAKGSLFDDDDDDDGDLFGSVKSAGVSTVSTKPVDIADTLFTSGLAKQILYPKLQGISQQHLVLVMLLLLLLQRK